MQHPACAPSIVPVGGIDALNNPRLNEIYQIWQDLPRENGLALRSGFQPMQVPRLLPHLAVIEVVAGGRDFLLRLVGTELVRAYKADWTGQRVSHFQNARVRDRLYDVYRRVIKSRQPHCVGPMVSELVTSHRLLTTHLDMPLSTDGQSVDRILAAAVFLNDTTCR